MASLQDYLRELGGTQDVQSENLLRNLGTYASNLKAAEALGVKDAGKPKRGLLSKTLGVLGIPSRLVQGAILEATGQATPEMKKVSGLEQVRQLVTGELQTGFGNLPGLKVGKKDNTATRIGKLVGAFALDTATDPLSYVGAPGLLSRKQASELLARTGGNLLDDVVSASVKGDSIIGDLVAKSPRGRAAKIQEDLRLAADPNTPLDILARQGERQVAQQELGVTLANALEKGGRREVIRTLEGLTGSKSAALSLFKNLPEEVRGGIVLSGLSGKPIENAAGEYVRLTQGTGQAVGPLGDLANKMRLQVAAKLSPALAPFSGTRGTIRTGILKGLAAEASDVTRGAAKGLEDELDEGLTAATSDNWLDYISIGEADVERKVARTQLQGKSRAVEARYSGQRKLYSGDDATVFETSAKDAFFAPQVELDVTAMTPAQRSGYQAGRELITSLNDLRDEAIAAGVEVGDLGIGYSPLILSDKAYEARKKLGKVKSEGNLFRTERGRRMFVEYDIRGDADMMKAFEDPENPGVYFANARGANELLAKRAKAEGKSAQEIADAASTFVEDPVMALQRYSNSMVDKISNKRFVDRLVQSGTLVRSAPKMRRALEQWEAATFTAALDNISDEVRRVANEAAADAEKRLAEVVQPTKLREVQAKILALRTSAESGVNYARAQEQEALRVLDLTSEAADRLYPQAQAIRSRLTQYESAAVENAADLRRTERIARNARARARTAQDRFDEATSPELFNVIDMQSASRQLDAAGQARAASEADLAAARGTRDTLRSGEIETQISAITSYEQAIARRNQALEAVQEARNARVQAVSNYKTAREGLMIEGVKSVETFVDSYMQAVQRFRRYVADNPITANMDAATKARIRSEAKALREAAVDSKKILRKTISATSSRFEGAAKEYADILINAVDNLSDDQFNAMLVLSSDTKIRQYIDVVTSGTASEIEVMQAMGDMWRTYSNIADLLPKDTFEKLGDKQRKLLMQGPLGQLYGNLFRTEKDPGLLAERLVSEGFESLNMGKGMEELYATSGVANLMREIYKTEQSPQGWQRFIRDTLDPLLNLWKLSVTIGRGPGYTTQNLIGGMWMNHMGDVSLADHKTMADALSKINSRVKAIAKANPEQDYYTNIVQAEEEVFDILNKTRIGDKGLGEIIDELFKRGAFFDTEMQAASQQIAKLGSDAPAGAFRKGDPLGKYYATEAQTGFERGRRQAIDALTTNRVMKFLGDTNQLAEMYLRGAAFIDGYRRYGDFGAAMSKVHLLHFNYQDLGVGDLWAKRIMPFYTWTRNNIPVQLRAMVMQPGKIQRAISLNEEFQRTFGADGDDSWLQQVLPEYMVNAGGVATRFKFGDNNIGTYMRLPFNDVDKLLSGEGAQIRGRELAGMLGPFTTPIEVAAGVNLQTGAKFQEGGEKVPGYYNLFRFLPGSNVYTDKEGSTRISGGYARGLGDLIPQLGLLERAASAVPGLRDIASTQSQRDRALTNVLNLAGFPGGVGVTTLGPTTISGELTRRIEKQRGGLTRAAANANVDIDWVREQLRNGLSPEEVQSLIRAGEGRVVEEDGKSTLKPETRSRYLDLLEGFK